MRDKIPTNLQAKPWGFIYRKFAQLLRGNLSFLMMFGGAGSFFIANLVMKDFLSPIEYGQYSLIITYFSLIYIFGIFGTEQGFIRFSEKLSTGQISTQRFQFWLILSVSIFSASASTIFFRTVYPEIKIDLILLFCSSFSMILLLLVFNVLRLAEFFFAAQLAANYWKIVLLAGAGLLFFYREYPFVGYVEIILYNIIGCCAICLIYILRNIRFKFDNLISKRELLQASAHFFISIATISVLLFFDRFVVEMNHNYTVFGNYFYLSNFFLAPYTIFQSYIGFKQLIQFKNSFNYINYLKFNRRIIIIGVILGFILSGLALGMFYSGFFKIDLFEYKGIIFLLLVLGIIRLYSSAITAAFEARTTIPMLRQSNIYIFFGTAIILTLIIFFASSITLILILTIFAWIIRCIVHSLILRAEYRNKVIR